MVVSALRQYGRKATTDEAWTRQVVHARHLPAVVEVPCPFPGGSSVGPHPSRAAHVAERSDSSLLEGLHNIGRFPLCRLERTVHRRLLFLSACATISTTLPGRWHLEPLRHPLHHQRSLQCSNRRRRRYLHRLHRFRLELLNLCQIPYQRSFRRKMSRMWILFRRRLMLMRRMMKWT